MQNKLFLKAADICELLEVKQTSAYEIIGNLAICAEQRPLVRLPAATRRSTTATLIKVFR